MTYSVVSEDRITTAL